MIELEPGEHIIAYLRKHWFRFLIELIPHIVLSVVPLGLLFFTNAFIPGTPGFRAAIFFVSLYYFLIWMHGFAKFTLYYLNMLVLTNHRIINAEQRHFFSRQVSTLELEHIQDIAIEVHGFIETFIGYGTIRVQTAGDRPNFAIEDAANPEESKQKIYEAQREALKIHKEDLANHSFN